MRVVRWLKRERGRGEGKTRRGGRARKSKENPPRRLLRREIIDSPRIGGRSTGDGFRVLCVHDLSSYRDARYAREEESGTAGYPPERLYFTTLLTSKPAFFEERFPRDAGSSAAPARAIAKNRHTICISRSRAASKFFFVPSSHPLLSISARGGSWNFFSERDYFP